MDKGRRNEITKLKHIKRCQAMGIKPQDHYCYKSQGKPCSCHVCSGVKYTRNIKHKNNIIVL